MQVVDWKGLVFGLGLLFVGLAFVPAGGGCGSDEASGGASSSGSGTTDSTGGGGNAGAGGSVAGGGGSGGSGGSIALSVSAMVRLNPECVVTAFVDVETTGAKSVVVEYGDTTAYGMQTPALDVPSSGKVTAVLLGLTPGAPSHARVRATGSAGATEQTADLSFACDAPPGNPFFPAIEVEFDDGTADGYILTTLSNPDPVKGRTVVMLDRKGRVMWYRAVDMGANAEHFERLPNGNFIVFRAATQVHEEVDLGNKVVRVSDASAPATEAGLDGHEFRYLPATDHAYTFGWQYHTEDTTSIGGIVNAHRADNTLVELDGLGGGTLLWSSYPEITIDELIPQPDLPINPDKFQSVHANAIEPTPDGKLLVSCRDISTILKIEPTTGEILWRLGGNKSDFTFVGDPLGRFTSQHDPRFSPEGHLRVYDNGNSHTPPQTRVVEYILDEVAFTATFVSAFEHDPLFYSPIAGDSRLLPNGDMLVDYATLGRVVQVDQNQALVWQLNLNGSGAYRSEYVPTLYP